MKTAKDQSRFFTTKDTKRSRSLKNRKTNFYHEEHEGLEVFKRKKTSKQTPKSVFTTKDTKRSKSLKNRKTDFYHEEHEGLEVFKENRK